MRKNERKEGSRITVLKGWMDRRIAIPHVAAAITQSLDYFLDFYDIEATHVRREENCFFVVLIACGVLSPFGYPFNAPLLVERRFTSGMSLVCRKALRSMTH